MKAATAVRWADQTDPEGHFDQIAPLYLQTLTLVERVHRRLLEDEFERRSSADINSVQALLVYNIGDRELGGMSLSLLK